MVDRHPKSDESGSSHGIATGSGITGKTSSERMGSSHQQAEIAAKPACKPQIVDVAAQLQEVVSTERERVCPTPSPPNRPPPPLPFQDDEITPLPPKNVSQPDSLNDTMFHASRQSIEDNNTTPNGTSYPDTSAGEKTNICSRISKLLRPNKKIRPSSISSLFNLHGKNQSKTSESLPSSHPMPDLEAQGSAPIAQPTPPVPDETEWTTSRILNATLALVAGFFQQYLCWGLIMGYGAIFSYYDKYLIPSARLPMLALIGAIPPFMLNAGSVVLGRFVDAGYHVKLNMVGSVFIVAGLVGMTFSTHNHGYDGSGCVWALSLSAVALGLGQSCLFVNASQTAATWFPNNKGVAIGFTSCGAAVGGFAFPLMFRTLASKHTYRTSMIYVTTMASGLALFICIFGRPSPSWDPRPIGRPKKSLKVWIPIQALTSRAFRLHIAAMCCVYSGILVVPFFLEYWAETRRIGYKEDIHKKTGHNIGPGWNRDVYLICLFNGSQVFGRLLGSALSDFIKARIVHAGGCFLSILLLFFWYFASNFAIATIFCCFFGGLAGLMVSLPVNDVIDILGPQNSAHLLGHCAGLVYTCVSPFVVTGPVIAAVLIERYGLNAAAFWVTACFSSGMILLLASVNQRDRVVNGSRRNTADVREKSESGSEV